MPSTPRSIWDFWAPRYEGLWAQRFSLQPSRELVHTRMAELDLDRPRLLDLGCGVGQFLLEAAERHPELEAVGFDPSASMIERARDDYAHPRVQHHVGDIDTVQRGTGFDLITCMHAFPYMPDKPAVMERLAALLRPGGRAMIVQANSEGLYDRLFLLFVKLTTTRARYHSTAGLSELMRAAGLAPEPPRAVHQQRLLPSIELVEGRQPSETAP